MIAALSIQLMLYSAAWLLLGGVFGLQRRSMVAWAVGWGALGVATFLLSHDAFKGWPHTPAVVNLLVVFAFVSLLWGVCAFTRQAPHWTETWLPLAGVFVVDVMRYAWTDESTMLRWVFFTLALTWPVLRISRRVQSSLQASGYGRLAALVYLPAFVTVLIFFVRVVAISMGAPLSQFSFDDRSAFSDISTIAFFLASGAFNFVLASLVISKLVERLRQLSLTDELTKLPNRRYMMNLLESEHARFRRSGSNYVILMIDVDHFKRVNDSLGHSAGDQVLRALAKVMAEQVRTGDHLARIGGEEFMILAPGTGLQAAQILAERIRNSIAARAIPLGATEKSVTVSIGAGIACPQDADIHAVMQRADAALYQAKANGRNRTEMSLEGTEGAPPRASPHVTAPACT